MIGTSSYPLEGRARVGVEAGGYLNRSGGTSAMARALFAINQESSVDLGLGTTTGARGARALIMARTSLLTEDTNTPALALRGGLETTSDDQGARRNAIGGGPLITKGFSFDGHELYAYMHPTAQLGLEQTSDTFVWITQAAIGVNAPIAQGWTGAVEGVMGFQHAATALTVGVATEI